MLVNGEHRTLFWFDAATPSREAGAAALGWQREVVPTCGLVPLLQAPPGLGLANYRLVPLLQAPPGLGLANYRSARRRVGSHAQQPFADGTVAHRLGSMLQGLADRFCFR